MPNFAIVQGDNVTNVVVAESLEIAQSLTSGTAVETSGQPWIGWALHGEEWRPPQPFPSWIWDGDWRAPTAMPTEGGPCIWDESALSWVDSIPAPTIEEQVVEDLLVELLESP